MRAHLSPDTASTTTCSCQRPTAAEGRSRVQCVRRRATAPAGPFVDRDSVSLLAGQVGGTPALSMNGNRWVGPGHNTVFTDVAGQDWVLYHAVDRTNPYFTGATGFTRRPLMMDMLVWKDGWPSVRNGLWASDTPQPAPAACLAPGQRARRNRSRWTCRTRSSRVFRTSSAPAPRRANGHGCASRLPGPTASRMECSRSTRRRRTCSRARTTPRCWWSQPRRAISWLKRKSM